MRNVAEVSMTTTFKQFFQIYFEATKQNENPEKSNTLAAKKPFSDVIPFPFRTIQECWIFASKIASCRGRF